MKIRITILIVCMLTMMVSCSTQVKESEVRIRDADMASEMLEMSENTEK